MLEKLATEAGKSEKEFLRETLERTASIKEAARLLKMSETGVKWHMKQFHMRVQRQVVTTVIEG